jgi:hypothetical protein
VRIGIDAKPLQGIGIEARVRIHHRRCESQFPLGFDRIGECPSESHRKRPCIGLEFIFGFWRCSRISDGDFDAERATANVLLAPTDAGADVIVVEGLHLNVDALVHILFQP